MTDNASSADGRTVTFSVRRFKPGRIDPPRRQSFRVPVNDATTVLEGLEYIRHRLDDSLMYRHACHHSACGTCALRVNGTERLACTTRVADLEGETIVLEPLAGFACVGDLVVTMDDLFRQIAPDWSYLRDCEEASADRTPEGVTQLMRLEDCIECGCCQSACPVVREHRRFMGPAVLAAAHRQIQNSDDPSPALLTLAAGPRGERWCRRALVCSRVCPTGVYPARHIADLRRLLTRGDEEAGS